MDFVLRIVLFLHIACSVASAVAFWIPVVSRKGSPLHVRAGRIYLRLLLPAMGLAVIVAALRMPDAGGAVPKGGGLLAPLSDDPVRYRLFVGFLVYVALATASSALFGVRALRREAPLPLDRLLHGALLGLAALALVSGVWKSMLPLVAVGLAGGLLSLGQCRAAGRVRASSLDRLRIHVTSMMASGVGLHTALLVVLANRVMPEFLWSHAGVVVWLVPVCVLIPCGMVLLARTPTARLGTHPP